jgi:hypothetical protein
MAKDKIKRFKYGAVTWAFVHLMFMLTCVTEMLIHGAYITWGIECYLKVAIKMKVKAFSLEQTTTKGSFSHAGMMTVVT